MKWAYGALGEAGTFYCPAFHWYIVQWGSKAYSRVGWVIYLGGMN